MSLMSRRHALVGLLCLAWILPGLIGHDPWKSEDAYTFGVVYEILRGGSWIVPSLAGEPFLDEPPLYYATAAATADLFSPLLPLHDGARLASGFYMALTLLFCALAGRELNGRGYGTLAAMLLLGCFGLAPRSHQLIADVGGLAGFALVYFGCARALRGPMGGVWLGTGIGVVFLSQGTPEAIIAALIAILLPLVSSAWRTRSYSIALTIAALAALPWVLIWPLALHAYSAEMFQAWLATDTVRRLFGGSGSGLFYFRILPWYTWPLWALALWSLWRAFGNGPVKPAITLPLLGLLITLLVLSDATEKRQVYVLPLILPLTLLAVPGIETLRRGAANAWYWFSIMGFTLFIVVGWVYWSGLDLGLPPRLHAHLLRLRPGYVPSFKVLPFALVVAYTVAWFVVLFRLRRTPQRPAIVWATGITVLWAMVAILFVGWFDAGRSYRGMTANLTQALPANYRCISSMDLGEAQRAMLHYFAGIVTYREEVSARRRDCDLMLVQGNPREEAPPQGTWTKIWEGSRPRDKDERFRLYQRQIAQAPVPEDPEPAPAGGDVQ